MDSNRSVELFLYCSRIISVSNRKQMRFISAVAAVLLATDAFAQVQQPCCKAVTLNAEVRAYGSSDRQLPFWLRANQFGIAPETNRLSPAYALQTRLGLHFAYSRPYHSRGLDWAAGVEAVSNLSNAPTEVPLRSGGNASANTRILLPEYYLKAKWRHFEGFIGRQRQTFGLVGDTTLTSGSYVWSGNALPLPKVEISVPDFWSFGFTKHLIAFKGSFAHGWFGNDPGDFVQNAYLHQLSLYGRFGKPSWKWHLYGGFNHQVQWHGYAPYFKDDKGVFSQNGHFASGWTPFYRVVLGISTQDNWRFSSHDGGNRIGNHLGTIDLGAEVKFKNSRLNFYRQNIYDDGSLFFLINITDGLNGLSWKNEKPYKPGFQVNKLVFEYINTISQGGPAFIVGDNFKRGQDNYFNHAQYRDGWTYKRRMIGTPFVSLRRDINPNILPPYAPSVANNRVSAFYLAGLLRVGVYSEIEMRTSYSWNLGVYAADSLGNVNYSVTFREPVRQFSSLLRLSRQLPWVGAGSSLNVALAYDSGRLFSSGFGGYVGFRTNIGNWAFRINRRTGPVAIGH